MPSQRSLNRILVNVLLDGALAAAAAPLARFLADPGGGLLHPIWFVAGGAITLLLSGLPFRLPQQYWRFSGRGDLVDVAVASVAGATLFSAGLALTGFPLPSVTFPVVHAFTLMALLGAARATYGAYHGRTRAEDRDATPVLLVGAGEPAELFIRACAQDRRAGMRVAGLLSLTGNQTGRRIHGNPILGGVDALEAVLARLRAEGAAPGALVLTDPGFAGAPLALLMRVADEAGIPVRRVPALTRLQAAGEEARGGGIELRPVAIEELLNRPQVPLDRDGIARLVAGRRVLVTGAGGTIGSELARQLAGLGPAELVLLDNGEYALWQIDLELAEAEPPAALPAAAPTAAALSAGALSAAIPSAAPPPVAAPGAAPIAAIGPASAPAAAAPATVRHVVIADVRDAGRLREVFARHRPELVFHAAALKHVPMVEANPLEGLLTNACGTRNVADAARAAGAAAMVLISTDKAVNPTSLMGASKRLAEMYCQALDIDARRAGRATTRFVTVRFGNVLGSTGSVVPLFRRQLARGGPLTVTHPDMQRYFMTVREAVGLVLQASLLGAQGSPDGDQDAAAQARGGPAARDGGIFVLDMGEPVRIVELARQMIRLAGLRPDEDVRIAYTGLRPGEKLFEELFHGREPPRPTGHPGLLMATPRTADPALVGRALSEIAEACASRQPARALAVLARLVPEFAPAEAGVLQGEAVP